MMYPSWQPGTEYNYKDIVEYQGTLWFNSLGFR